MIWWLDGRVTQVQQLLLNGVDLLRLQANRRQYRATGLFRNSHQHITATQVVKVIGKGAKAVQDGLRVPTCLVFNAFAFHRALVEEVIEVDGEFARHLIQSQ